MNSDQPNPLLDLLTVLKENFFIQLAVVLPIVSFCLWFFGFYNAWGSFVVVTIVYSIKTIAQQKEKRYERFIKSESISLRQFDEDQKAAWLNLLIAKYWKTCVPAWVKPEIEKVNAMMLEKKPKWMKRLEIVDWNLGDRPPRIDRAFPLPELSDDKYELDAELHFLPDFRLEVAVQPMASLDLRVVVTDVKFKGRLRLAFAFNNLFPDYSVVSVSFVGQPIVECTVKPFNKVSLDVIAVPLIYDLVNEIIASNLRARMLWPQKMMFSFGGGTVETPSALRHPITDISFIYASEKKAPPGYILLERTCSGLIPADLNRGTEGTSMFLCYKREEGAEPITALSVFFPSLGEKPPEGFQTIEETLSGENACLNAGNKNAPEAFLCFKRGGDIPPITGITLFDENEYSPFPETHQLLELTPTGRKANLNKKLPEADRLFLAYRGGVRSYFGYPRVRNEAKGLLRINLVEARNIVAADVGGTSDPFVEFIIGDPKLKETPRKFSTVIDKTLTPKWGETFIFAASTSDVLTVNLYDKDLVGKPDFLGRLQIPLADCVVERKYDQWFDLQLIESGELHLQITALDFGKGTDTPVTPLTQTECTKDQGNFLTDTFEGIGGTIGAVGGVGIKALGSVGGAGVKAVGSVGGAGVKAVGSVGGAGVKAVGAVGGAGVKAVGSVGGAGVKAVTSVGGVGVKAVTSVGGIFGAGKKDKESRKSLETSREELKTKQSTEPVAAFVAKSGELEQLGGMIPKFGKRKPNWVVLNGGSLKVYKSQKDFEKSPDQPQGSYELDEAIVDLTGEHKMSFILQAKGHKEHFYRATSEEDLHDWILQIGNNIRKVAQDKQ